MCKGGKYKSIWICTLNSPWLIIWEVSLKPLALTPYQPGILFVFRCIQGLLTMKGSWYLLHIGHPQMRTNMNVEECGWEIYGHIVFFPHFTQHAKCEKSYQMYYFSFWKLSTNICLIFKDMSLITSVFLIFLVIW